MPGFRHLQIVKDEKMHSLEIEFLYDFKEDYQPGKLR